MELVIRMVYLVEIEGLGKRFENVIALDAIDATIDHGEIVGIIGPSGSGKTTALRLLLGHYKASNGSVEVFGKRPESFSREDREHIGYLPQHFLLYEDLTVYENLAFVAGMYGLGLRERRERIDEMLELVQLDDARDRASKDISGGMQRRLALASALIHDPLLIVLDEPTAGIDPLLRVSLWEVFADLKARGRSLVVTTQYVTEAEYCDRVYLISGGNVVASGTPRELRRMVYGGDVVRIRLSKPDEHVLEHLIDLPYVESGRQTGPAEVELVVDRAYESIPKLADEVSQRGNQASEIEERQTSFDNVFVALVERSEENETATGPSA